MKPDNVGRFAPLRNIRTLTPGQKFASEKSATDLQTNTGWRYWQANPDEHRYPQKVANTALG